MIDKIKSLEEIDIKSLALDDRFGDLKFNEVYPKLEEIKNWILEFLELNFEKKLPDNKVEKIRNNIGKYGEYLEWLKNFSISTSSNPKQEHDDFENQINGFHQSFFENFVIKYLSFLNLNKKSFKKDKDFDLEKIKDAEKIADIIIKNEEKYKKASETAENWIKTEGRAISSAIKDKTKIFNDKAKKEHTGWGVWPWLIGSILFLIGAIAMALILINKLSENGEDISVGASLLRISVIGMFAYGSFLAYQQFGIQRRLYESYKFKAIALSTMEELVKNYGERRDRELIMNKAIDIIFSEPSLKEEKIAHQRMIDDLLDILKSKV